MNAVTLTWVVQSGSDVSSIWQPTGHVYSQVPHVAKHVEQVPPQVPHVAKHVEQVPPQVLRQSVSRAVLRGITDPPYTILYGNSYPCSAI
jgi:hypothetical protein